MKAILMSIRPQHVANILNGLKTIEIRKHFPKDYIGWVYIYCTKGKPYLSSNSFGYYIPKKYEKYMGNHNGKVVARFWCDKVENIIFGATLYNDLGFFTGDLYSFDLYKQSCLTKEEMHNYLKIKPNGLSGYAIHITKLEPFDKPKEISEFKVEHCSKRTCHLCEWHGDYGCISKYHKLTRAPESWQYIEVDL